MTAIENGSAPRHTSSVPREAAGAGVHALQMAASRFAEMRRGSPFRTRELVSLLLGHAARSWRASLPAAMVTIRVASPEGGNPVRLRLP